MCKKCKDGDPVNHNPTAKQKYMTREEIRKEWLKIEARYMKIINGLKINILITSLSFLIFIFFDWPIELIAAIGITWVWIDCVESIMTLNGHLGEKA